MNRIRFTVPPARRQNRRQDEAWRLAAPGRRQKERCAERAGALASDGEVQMMNRRQALKATLTAATAAAVLRPGRLAAQDAGTRAPGAAGDTIYLNPATGTDTNPGTKDSPLRTLAEAARRVNKSDAAGPMTIVLSRGHLRGRRDDVAQARAPFVLEDGAADHPRRGAPGRPRVAYRPDADAHPHDARSAHLERAARPAGRRGGRHDDRDQPRDDSGAEDPRPAGGGDARSRGSSGASMPSAGCAGTSKTWRSRSACLRATT